MRKKINSLHKMFNLDKDAIQIIKEVSKAQGISQSELIEFWAFNFDENISPHKKIQNLKKKQKELKSRLNDLEKQEEVCLNQLGRMEDWKKEKQKKKPFIISNLMRVLSENRYEDAEQMAKTQGIRLGVSYIELLTEALNKLKMGQ